MVLQPDQERVRALLTDTITLLCKNGLSYKTEFCISGVIGITLDQNDVFLVDIRETIKQCLSEDNDNEIDCCPEENAPTAKKRRKQKPSNSSQDANNVIEILSDPSEDVLNIKTEHPQLSVLNQIVKTDPDQLTDYDNTDSISYSQVIGTTFATTPNLFNNTESLLSSTLNRPVTTSRPQSNVGDTEKPYKCSICNQTMSTSNGLRYHMNRHKGIFPYYCPYCNKGQPGTTDLKNHLASMHTNGMPAYLCIYCMKAANSVSKLKSHLNECELAKAAKSLESSTPPIQAESENSLQNMQDFGDTNLVDT